MAADVIQRLAAAAAPAREAWTRPGAEPRLIRGITYLLLAFGLAAVFSASTVESLNTYGNAWTVFLKQLLFAVVGVTLMLGANRVPVSVVRRFIPLIAVACLAGLVLVLVIGASVNGQKNWIPLGVANIQPSEFAKLGFILWAADRVARRSQHSSSPRYVAAPILLGATIVMGLILLEKDMGNLLVTGLIMLLMLFSVGAPGRLIASISGMGLVGFVIVLLQGSSYRRERILNWRNPWADPQGYGWQFIRGTYALAVGGLLGQGPGASKEKWGALPEAHTDFILAVIGEEYGFVGTVVTVGLVFALLVLLLRVAIRLQDDPFRRTFIVGVASWLFIQTVMNVGAVVGFLPIIGVTLPLVSYGGSSLLPLLVGLGIVVRCLNEPEAREVEQ